MILGDIRDYKRYELLHPLFTKAFSFLNQTSLDVLPDGRNEIEGENLFAIVSRNGTSFSDNKLEAHKKYIDIHFAVYGEDTIAWKPLQDCKETEGSFNTEKDVIFFSDKTYQVITLSSKNFMIVYPEDAHAPLLKTTDLFKLVLKIKL